MQESLSPITRTIVSPVRPAKRIASNFEKTIVDCTVSKDNFPRGIAKVANSLLLANFDNRDSVISRGTIRVSLEGWPVSLRPRLPVIACNVRRLLAPGGRDCAADTIRKWVVVASNRVGEIARDREEFNSPEHGQRGGETEFWGNAIVKNISNVRGNESA